MHIPTSAWELTIFGLVPHQRTLSWADLRELPATAQRCDVHCVTGWTLLDSHWRGVRLVDVLKTDEPLPEARHAVIHASGGWTTNLPLEELLRDDVLLA